MDIRQWVEKSIQEEISDLEKFDLIPYGPVKSTDDLFPLHRKQAEDLANIISCSSTDPFSICLSGKWGTGKTSVISNSTELVCLAVMGLWEVGQGLLPVQHSARETLTTAVTSTQ